MERLASADLIRPVRRGLWSLDPRLDPYVLAGYVVAPYPAYVSLWSALYLHGVIDQIPQTIFLVSLTRSQRIRTRLSTYSVHHIDADLFLGFEVKEPTGVNLATAEKAIFDLAYFSSGRSRLFAATPEIELPRGFRWANVSAFIERISSPLVTTRVRRYLGKLRKATRKPRSK